MKWLVLLAATAAACAPVETNVGRAKLADADFTVTAPEGPLVEILAGAPLPSLAKGTVRFAVDRDVPFQQVLDALAAARTAGADPVLLVARRDHVERFPLWTDKASGDAIRLKAKTEGKACVSPPDNEEATCVARADHKHIDRAFVRQILWQAVKEYGLTRVHVTVDKDLLWGDAVRAIDGARTCCGEKQAPEVTVQ